jgi:hypothetical protein
MMMEEAARLCPRGSNMVDLDTFLCIMDNSTWY